MPTVWTNVLCAIVLSQTVFSVPYFLILALSMSLFYSGGMCLNDIYDEKIDRIKKSFRPIPSGCVSKKNAYILTVSIFIVALLLLLSVPYKESSLAGILLLLLIIIYDKYHKAHPLSVILMAACRMLIFIICSIALTGAFGKLVILAGLTQFLFVLTISISARYENKSNNQNSYSFIPLMISCIPLIDGILMAIFISPGWILAGICGMVLTLAGQKYVRGD